MRRPAWEPYDPSWLVELARRHCPELPWLPDALAECTSAYRNTCCTDRICGYYFVDNRRANRRGSLWLYETSLILGNDGDSGPRSSFVILDILKGRRIGEVEFH